ncbi:MULTISPECIES: CDP-alcohol phosphatidyltransferase family protein [Nocardia]|uniref:CDP-diacylglycerol--serine O-phosphatidyltransferase n=1 Tax=Nocardia sputorum TaxID=2984338 RepID=A0ABN6UC42_9NOCA|nr:phosphatidylcholine/phosphatidylserine synthase [Nocardia sputorum]BDT93781.1 putative CDP-diacylglycerol--serine O-phosphatidyltransferase [Nocardia sputorum]BDU02883.1 putative CDP-diacylglycerol--serine O-phosphatidyltransferase [Nocardia sputorum]
MEAAVPTQRRRRRSIRLLPSIVTILALCSGLSAVKFGLDGQLGIALAMIGAAAVLDTLDGRLARMLDATTKMGAELDSLSDAISFGVAPALVLYVTLLSSNSVGWIVALLFAVSLVLRLARFNTLMDDDTRPDWAREYFVGVPAPAAALIAMVPVALFVQFGDGWWVGFYEVAAWTVFAAALAVSTIPTLAMKSVSVAPQAAAGLLVLVALAAAALVTYPIVLLLVLVALYLGHIPFAWHSQRWVAARPETWTHKPAERRAQRRADRRLPAIRRPAIRRPALPRPAIRGSARLRLRRPGAKQRQNGGHPPSAEL